MVDGLFSFPEIWKILRSKKTYLFKVVQYIQEEGGRREKRRFVGKFRRKVSFFFFFKENELLTSYQSGVISSKDVNFSRQFN